MSSLLRLLAVPSLRSPAEKLNMLDGSLACSLFHRISSPFHRWYRWYHVTPCCPSKPSLHWKFWVVCQWVCFSTRANSGRIPWLFLGLLYPQSHMLIIQSITLGSCPAARHFRSSFQGKGIRTTFRGYHPITGETWGAVDTPLRFSGLRWNPSGKHHLQLGSVEIHPPNSPHQSWQGGAGCWVMAM